MPTGNTYMIEEVEKPFSFAQYVWTCARYFTIGSRENDGFPPVEMDPDTDYENRSIERMKAELADIETKSDEQLQIQLDAEFAERMKEWTTNKAKSEQVHLRYVEMLAQVEAWEPPSEKHKALKEFMLEQIHTSHPTGEKSYYKKNPPAPKQVASSYRSTKTEWLRQDLFRSEQRIKEIAKKTEERNEYFRTLNASVPRPSPSE